MATTARVDISRDGDATVFTVVPGGARRSIQMALGGATFIGAGLLWRGFLGEPLFWMCIILGGGIVALGMRDVRPASHRRKSVIRVSGNGFEVNGASYPRVAVKRLIVRNPLQSQKTERTIVFTGPTAADVNAQMAAHEGWEREWAHLAAGTYEIILDANDKDTVIAGNLSADSVDRLLRSLCDVSGMTYRAS